LTLGLATLSAAFQCKRWQGSVGRPEVDKFRGAIQGDFEQGVFFATSDFTREAREASLKKGAAPIILLNGESIVRLMIEKGIGVSRTALFAYSDELDDLIEGD
jgi:restriction system protein